LERKKFKAGCGFIQTRMSFLDPLEEVRTLFGERRRLDQVIVEDVGVNEAVRAAARAA
jgi:hypothetical protein